MADLADLEAQLHLADLECPVDPARPDFLAGPARPEFLEALEGRLRQPEVSFYGYQRFPP